MVIREYISEIYNKIKNKWISNIKEYYGEHVPVQNSSFKTRLQK